VENSIPISGKCTRGMKEGGGAAAGDKEKKSCKEVLCPQKQKGISESRSKSSGEGQDGENLREWGGEGGGGGGYVQRRILTDGRHRNPSSRTVAKMETGREKKRTTIKRKTRQNELTGRTGKSLRWQQGVRIWNWGRE